MRKYEGVFIFNPSVEEDNRNEYLDRLKEIIEKDGAVIEVDEWGIRKLAYEINDLTEGYYFVINFESTPTIVTELDRVCKLSDNIMRYMIIREDN